MTWFQNKNLTAVYHFVANVSIKQQIGCFTNLYVKQGKHLKHYCINMQNDFDDQLQPTGERRGMILDEFDQDLITPDDLELTVSFINHIS